jgi:hypothetical protein
MVDAVLLWSDRDLYNFLQPEEGDFLDLSGGYPVWSALRAHYSAIAVTMRGYIGDALRVSANDGICYALAKALFTRYFENIILLARLGPAVVTQAPATTEAQTEAQTEAPVVPPVEEEAPAIDAAVTQPPVEEETPVVTEMAETEPEAQPEVDSTEMPLEPTV